MPRASYEHRRPDGWSEPSAVGDVIVVGGREIHRSGVCVTSPEGEEITGSAAGLEREVADRSWFELLERVSLVEATRKAEARIDMRDRDGQCLSTVAASSLFPESDDPSRWRYARSNGVALHTDWRSACDRALWELVERDRVLRAWYGWTAPRTVTTSVPACLSELADYEVAIREFPSQCPRTSDAVRVAGVFAFPTRTDLPLAFGYGARATLEDAVEAAAAEALQLLSFLWGEEVPAEAPARRPAPSAHLEHWLYPGHHATLRAWVDRGSVDRASSSPSEVTQTPLFADLTPSWLGGGMRVAKAMLASASPLAFGDSPFVAHLPEELRVHPIP